MLTKVDKDPDWGLFHNSPMQLEFLKDAYAAHDERGIYPDGGGLNNQCPMLLEDFKTLDWLVAFFLFQSQKNTPTKDGKMAEMG